MDNKSKNLTEEQIKARQLSLIEQFKQMVGDANSVKKSLIIANSGHIKAMQDEDDCFNITMSQVNDDVYLVCAFLDLLMNPETDSSILDIHDLFTTAEAARQNNFCHE